MGLSSFHNLSLAIRCMQDGQIFVILISFFKDGGFNHEEEIPWIHFSRSNMNQNVTATIYLCSASFASFVNCIFERHP